MLDGEDLVGDVLANDQVVRFEKKQVKNTTSSAKTLTDAAAASKVAVEEKKELPKKCKTIALVLHLYWFPSAEAPPTFTTEIKEIKDEAGDIVDSQLFVVFKDAKLIEAVRYANLQILAQLSNHIYSAFISTDKLYDKEPRINAETLLQVSSSCIFFGIGA